MPAERTKGQSRPDFTDVPDARRRNMAAVGSRDTKPEMAVRRALHAMGFRFRLHRRDLPGSPDIVLPRWKSVVLVHGCQWHAHQGCPKFRIPATRKDWWEAKLTGNAARDRRNQAALAAQGWQVLVVWECELHRGRAGVLDRLASSILKGRSHGAKTETHGEPT